ncbi:MAG: hypothetical protein ACI9YR_002869 [Bacteroidia bacterium]|jgi:hypothetical protein
MSNDDKGGKPPSLSELSLEPMEDEPTFEVKDVKVDNNKDKSKERDQEQCKAAFQVDTRGEDGRRSGHDRRKSIRFEKDRRGGIDRRPENNAWRNH